MAICKCGDGWQICYACCNKNGLLGYPGQTQEPNAADAPRKHAWTACCFQLHWSLSEALFFWFVLKGFYKMGLLGK